MVTAINITLTPGGRTTNPVVPVAGTFFYLTTTPGGMCVLQQIVNGCREWDGIFLFRGDSKVLAFQLFKVLDYVDGVRQPSDPDSLTVACALWPGQEAEISRLLLLRAFTSPKD